MEKGSETEHLPRSAPPPRWGSVAKARPWLHAPVAPPGRRRPRWGMPEVGPLAMQGRWPRLASLLPQGLVAQARPCWEHWGFTRLLHDLGRDGHAAACSSRAVGDVEALTWVGTAATPPKLVHARSTGASRACCATRAKTAALRHAWAGPEAGGRREREEEVKAEAEMRGPEVGAEVREIFSLPTN
jgi:hypothetical protein